MLISGPVMITTPIQRAAMSGSALPQPHWAGNGRADCMGA